MNKRKSSSRVTLVLIGAAAMALAACAKEEVRRDLYASKEDCLADWGQSPQDCEPAYDKPTGSANRTHYYGRPYSYRSGGSSASPSRSGRTIGSSSSVSRGGFGGSGRSASG